MSALSFAWNREREKQGSLSVNFTACAREPQSWKEEVYAAARAIAKRAQKPIFLCFSGGLQSEIMCRAFFDQGIAFTPLTLAHAQNANASDRDHARAWCWDRGIKWNEIAFDTEAFFGTTIDRWIEEGYHSTNAMRYLQIALLETAENLGGFAVLGDGIPRFRALAGSDVAHIRFGSGERIPSEWCARHGTEHEPFFFRSTPELWASYLSIPVVQTATMSPNLFRSAESAHLFNRVIVRGEWPDVSIHGYSFPFGTFRPRRIAKEKELGARLSTMVTFTDVPADEARTALSASTHATLPRP